MDNPETNQEESNAILDERNVKPLSKSDKISTGYAFSLSKLNGLLGKYIIWVYCILILGWAGIRFSYYSSIVKSPLYSLYLFSESDNKFFDDWAKYLNYDGLNASPLHPYHFWHQAFAKYYLQKHPEKLKDILSENNINDPSFAPGKALWEEWYHGNQYHQEPLYPYMLSAFIYLGLDEVKTMIIIQLLLGVVTGVLLFSITRKYFGETVAVLTGILYFFCGILMYNEILLLRTSWIIFFTMLDVFFLIRAFSRHSFIDLILCGLCIGLSFLMSAVFALFLIGAIIIISEKQPLHQLLKRSGLLVLGFLVMYSPVIIRNKIVGAPAFSISSVGPSDIISCNVYGTKSISAWEPSAEKDAEIIGRSNKNMAQALVATLKTYPSLTSFCILEWQKLKAAWIGIEYPNNENYYFYKRYISVLRLAFLNFFWIAPFGMAGLIFCIQNRKKYPALYLAIIVQVIVLLSTLVLARLRAPLVILLLPFAAFAVVECINIWIKERKRSFVKIGIIAVFTGISFAGYSAKLDDEIIDDSNYRILYDTYFKDKLKEFEANKQWSDWLALQKQIMDMEPGYIKNIILNTTEKTTINYLGKLQLFSQLHMNRKIIYDSLGDKEGALHEINIYNSYVSGIINSFKNLNISDAVKSNPEASYRLAKLYLDLKKIPQAIDILHKMVELDTDNEELNMDLGKAFLLGFQYDSSEIYDKKTLNINPKNINALFNLASVYFFKGEFTKTIELLKIEIVLNPDDVAKYANIGSCYLLLNKLDSAVYYTNKAISLDTTFYPSYQYMAVIYKKIGNLDSVKKYETIAAKIKGRK